jgi:hypothetical protein
MNFVERPGTPIYRDGRRIEIIELVLASSAVPKSAKAKWKRRYTVFPYTWEVALCDCQAPKTLLLAMHLAYEHWYHNGRPLPLANVGLAARGIDRKAKKRGLAYLEGRGLIRVERRPRKSPTITCLQMEGCPVKGIGHGA